MLDKNTNAQHFLTTVGYTFSNFVHCDIPSLVEKISALFCFLDVFGIAVPEFSH